MENEIALPEQQRMNRFLNSKKWVKATTLVKGSRTLLRGEKETLEIEFMVPPDPTRAAHKSNSPIPHCMVVWEDPKKGNEVMRPVARYFWDHYLLAPLSHSGLLLREWWVKFPTMNEILFFDDNRAWVVFRTIEYDDLLRRV